MTARIDAGASRPLFRKLVVSLMAGGAVAAAALCRPDLAQALAPKDLTPVWEPAPVVGLVTTLPADLTVGVAPTREPVGPKMEVAAVSSEPARTSNAAKVAPLSFGGHRSGLPWASGSNAGDGFGSWRRRPQDIHVMFSGRESWENIRRVPGFATTRRYAAIARVSLGLAMLINSQRGNFAACAAGVNDEHIRAVARGLVANGAGNSVVRLGWEMNGRGFPWSVGNFAAAAPLYRACFIRLASIIRAEAPDVLIEWAPRKSTDPRIRLEALYPGDEYVDVIGLLYYDWWPASPTEADWARNIVERDRHGGPRGLATWLAFARDRGKPLALAEWGIGKHGALEPFDNPLFIKKMFQFFNANAADIAYEGYFNGARHRIYSPGEGPVAGPNSAVMYRNLFGAMK